MRVYERDHIRTERIREELEIEFMVEKIDRCCIKWTAHVDRMEDYM
jgi:hypothetical protein